MDMKSIRAKTGLSQGKFAKKYGLPKITVESWEQGVRTPPAYVLDLLNFRVEAEKIKPMGYVLIDMTEEEYTWKLVSSEEEAVEYATKEWESKTEGQKLVYKIDPSAVYSVAFAPLEWDGDRFVPLLKGEIELVWAI